MTKYNKLIKEVESLTERKKRGQHWLPLDNNVYQCTSCGQVVIMLDLHPYCPYCGEKKDVGY